VYRAERQVKIYLVYLPRGCVRPSLHRGTAGLVLGCIDEMPCYTCRAVAWRRSSDDPYISVMSAVLRVYSWSPWVVVGFIERLIAAWGGSFRRWLITDWYITAKASSIFPGLNLSLCLFVILNNDSLFSVYVFLCNGCPLFRPVYTVSGKNSLQFFSWITFTIYNIFFNDFWHTLYQCCVLLKTFKTNL